MIVLTSKIIQYHNGRLNKVSKKETENHKKIIEFLKETDNKNYESLHQWKITYIQNCINNEIVPANFNPQVVNL
jgi:hypothetical protein